MGTLVFQANLGGTVNLIGPNTASTVNFTLPSADGTSGQALVTNGSGTLSFSTFTSGAAGSNTQVQFNSSGAFAGSANLTFDGTTLTAAGLSGPHNGTVGATTPNTGSFTTLTASSSVTLSGGTANGVVYLNGSKVVTTGSALTFDGTTLLQDASAASAQANFRVQTNTTGAVANGYFNINGTDYFRIYTTSTETGLRNLQNTSMYFSVNNTEGMRLTSTGLGIGTSSPATGTAAYPGSWQPAFQVYGGTNAVGIIRSGTGDARLNLVSGGAATNQKNWFIDATTAGSLAIATGLDTLGGTTRLTIDSSGNLLVGTTSNSNNRRFITSSALTTYAPNRMEMTASSGAMGGLYIVYTAQSPNDATSQFIGCDDSTTARFSVRSNGGIANYSANNVNLSDRREKTNFAPAGEYLSKICAIPVQTFNYIDQNLEEDVGLTLGVVAQDVQAVAPELVMESNWGTEEEPKMRLSIYQTDLQYALMKALQELKAEFDAYKATHP